MNFIVGVIKTENELRPSTIWFGPYCDFDECEVRTLGELIDEADASAKEDI